MSQCFGKIDADRRRHLDDHGFSCCHLAIYLIGVIADGQCPNRADLHALSAADAGGIHKILSVRRHDLRMKTAVFFCHNLDALHLAAAFHAASAENAFFHITDNTGGRLVFFSRT